MTTMAVSMITSATEADVAAAWARLGVMLNVEPVDRTPDVERLLLDTARLAPGNVRLFVLAATWLHRFSSYVAGSSAVRMVQDELDDGFPARAGAHAGVGVAELTSSTAIEVCRGSIHSAHKLAAPLLDVPRTAWRSFASSGRASGKRPVEKMEALAFR